MGVIGSSLNGVWRLLQNTFALEGASGQSKSHSDEHDPIDIAKQAVDAAARNALLEIHFRDMKDRPRTPRRFTDNAADLERFSRAAFRRQQVLR